MIAGLPTNIEFLRKLAQHEAFASGDVDTTFIPQYHDELLPPLQATPQRVLAAVALTDVVLSHTNSGTRALVSRSC